MGREARGLRVPRMCHACATTLWMDGTEYFREVRELGNVKADGHHFREEGDDAEAKPRAKAFDHSRDERRPATLLSSRARL